MKNLLLLTILMALGYSAEYKAVVQPYEKRTISSEVNGRITKLNQADELKTIDEELMVIDNELESIKLANLIIKAQSLKKQLDVKTSHYERIKKLSGKSQYEKDRYLNEMLTLKMQYQDAKNIVAELKDIIAKKNLSVNNLYLKKLFVRKGEYVRAGTPLFEVEDHSKSRITIYISRADLVDLEKKKILINGSETHEYKIEKVATSADDKYLSLYRVELVKNSPSKFGEVLSVEVK
ncbi:MAG: HlyD family efflux transporter periplasmic adaptor subunit [Helicobacteraceae bacterium]|nr:HlyD family efflux transporter periplasmic adaptor subunit [Helicobacteraceae bacterium]